MEAPIAAVNSMQGLYNMALALATRAHEGQVDHAGAPYILHPIRVAERCRTMEAKIVALLHDTTDLTPAYLLQQGFPTSLVEAVISVTRREGEDYEEYVRRSAANHIGREVKIADLEDNMDLRRLPELTERDVARTRKYLHAWHYLQDPISLPDR